MVENEGIEGGTGVTIVPGVPSPVNSTDSRPESSDEGLLRIQAKAEIVDKMNQTVERGSDTIAQWGVEFNHLRTISDRLLARRRKEEKEGRLHRRIKEMLSSGVSLETGRPERTFKELVDLGLQLPASWEDRPSVKGVYEVIVEYLQVTETGSVEVIVAIRKHVVITKPWELDPAIELKMNAIVEWRFNQDQTKSIAATGATTPKIAEQMRNEHKYRILIVDQIAVHFGSDDPKSAPPSLVFEVGGGVFHTALDYQSLREVREVGSETEKTLRDWEVNDELRGWTIEYKPPAENQDIPRDKKLLALY